MRSAYDCGPSGAGHAACATLRQQVCDAAATACPSNGIILFCEPDSTVVLRALLLCTCVQGLGMKVLAYDVRQNPAVEAMDIPYHDMDYILPRADVISLHVPLLPSTHHLINKERCAASWWGRQNRSWCLSCFACAVAASFCLELATRSTAHAVLQPCRRPTQQWARF